ncbi:DUF1501 domain-containing protein [Luteolibacter arcticus]|uniref:DUF1501 domain-containing protein n=1 Tax=Luteolibacter arcticus TaxID=1581411 RepID=A0ABT3GPA8_9BACT|nr:DUF1501 domain-containing protein [Luteolibacter arcticus]MCW1925343.1 DUF1501 domain-containing protein [Luteolibacter arcticus]
MSTIDQDRARLLRSRRSFFRTIGGAALGSAAISTTLRDFRLINSALAQGNGVGGSFTDYKALVCIFLNGGNDANNLIIPRGAQHANYAAIRGNLFIPESLLLPISPLNNDGNEYGFHPGCPQLANLFQAGKLATLFNVGPLLFPTNRVQYQKKLVALPPQLFSHSDQVTHWQTSLPDQPPRSGWGGRVADYLHPYQTELLEDPVDRAKVSLCTSIAGANTFEVGNTVQQFHVSTSGAVTLAGAASNSTSTAERGNVIRRIARLNQENLQADAFGDVIDNAIIAGAILNDSVAATSSGAPANWVWNTPFPSGGLGDQLKMVARIIAGRKNLKVKRQIFFVSAGGYDTHTAQLGDGTQEEAAVTGSHANLLATLSQAIGAFQAAIEQIAAYNNPLNPDIGDPALANNVVGFTTSDFGRTFPTNGQGSDHGWGSHHLIFGGNGNPTTGAVIGKKTYGTFPVLTVNGPDDTSTGRWIPTTSVDEYSATMAKWFGVDAAHLPVVFPNLGRFATPDLGFMRV